MPSKLESEDYYIEGGYKVFTAEYHLKRGFCCGNKCRHCPYDSCKLPTIYNKVDKWHTQESKSKPQ